MKERRFYAKQVCENCFLEELVLILLSGQTYTIIRPGHLYDGPLASAKIVAGQTNGTFAGGMKSTRADVAAFCVMAATAANATNATIEIASDPKSKGEKVIHPSILDSIKPDYS